MHRTIKRLVLRKLSQNTRRTRRSRRGPCAVPPVMVATTVWLDLAKQLAEEQLPQDLAQLFQASGMNLLGIFADHFAMIVARDTT